MSGVVGEAARLDERAREMEDDAQRAFGLIGQAEGIIRSFLEEVALAQRHGGWLEKPGLRRRASDWQVDVDALLLKLRDRAEGST